MCGHVCKGHNEALTILGVVGGTSQRVAEQDLSCCAIFRFDKGKRQSRNETNEGGKLCSMQ